MYFVIVFGCCVVFVRGVLIQDESEAILSSLKLLKIGECVISFEKQEESVKVIEKFGRNLISTGYREIEHLGEEIQKKHKPPDAPTAVVIQTKSSAVVKNLFKKISKRLHWFVWFLLMEEELDPEIRIPYNCQLFHMRKEPSRRIYHFMEIFHIKNSSAFINEFGVWTPGRGLTATSLSMYRRRTDMKGIKMEITLCNIYRANEEMLMFWGDTAKILNFTLKMEPQKLNKTPSGNVFLFRHDGSTCVWGITGLDFDQDWLFSSFGNKVRLTMKFRGTNDVGWRAYVQPFTREMWMAVGVWLFLSTAAIVIVNGTNRKSFYLNAFTAFYCLCNSDPTVIHPPDVAIPLPTKLVYLMSLAVPGVIVPAYSAYILSSISIILPLEPFNDLKGFIRDGTYKLAVVENTFVLRSLKNTKDPELKHIYKNLFVGDENLAPTFRALFEQLCKDNKLAGLFVDHKSFRQLFKCRMLVMQQEILTISTGVLLPKGSPFRKMLNERLTEYHEKGVKYRTSVSPYVRKITFDHETERLNSLNMSQMQAIFLLLPLGVGLSLVVLAVEIIIKRRSDRRQKAFMYESPDI